jgi:hypothetical protein
MDVFSAKQASKANTNTNKQPTVDYMTQGQALLAKDQQQRLATHNMLSDMQLKLTGLGDSVMTPQAEYPTDHLRYMKELVDGLKHVRKSLLKPHKPQPGSSPQEMMLFHQLFESLRKSPRPASAIPVERPVHKDQLRAYERLMEQAHNLGDELESPEATVLHHHAHAQSRVLHRLSHLMETMNDGMDEKRARRYDDMLTVLMHHHLDDPDYHDPLHDHLLAHHLSFASHTPREFDDHLANHLLYHDNGRHMEEDEDHNIDPYLELSKLSGLEQKDEKNTAKPVTKPAAVPTQPPTPPAPKPLVIPKAN